MYVNEKIKPGEIIPEKGERGDKGEWWGGEFKYDILDTL
jgi:hypothetical protein